MGPVSAVTGHAFAVPGLPCLSAFLSAATPPPAVVCRNGVMDQVLHPVEPLAVRLTLTAVF